MLPLWVSYLVRVYSWRLILNPDGALNWALNRLGLPDQNIAYTNWAMWLVFTYIWFPFMVLPVYAALERVPYSYVEASADLGGRGLTTLRRVILPLAVPGLAAGSIFTFSLTLGDYIAPSLVGGPGSSLIGNGRLREPRAREQRAVRGRVRDGPARDHGRLPRADEAPRGVREPLMETRAHPHRALGLGGARLPFLWIPLAIMGVYAFNSSNIQSWPIPGFTTKWFSEAWNDEEVRDGALAVAAGRRCSRPPSRSCSARSRRSGSRARGSSAATRSRSSSSCRSRCPGSSPGLALNSFFVIWGVSFSLWTIVIGHATFCVVIVYNNVLARLRRTSGSFFEASADLGATGFQTFRYVTLPVDRDGARRRRRCSRSRSRGTRSSSRTSRPARRTRCRCSSSASSARARTCRS